jgi:alanyl-tRNA synthetase
MKLIVDRSSRFAKMRAHTATHLLHSQLANIFPNTKQEWSLVDNDLLRFDFSADRLLDQQELASIEKKINQIIYLACDVTVQEMSIDDAAKIWAKMFFEDKYGDTVRVVQVKNTSIPAELQNDDIPEYFALFGDSLSTELCGWTHVPNTKDIWCFTIIWQEAVASGIKRITAITWPKVLEKIQEVQSILDITVSKLWIKTPTQLSDKLDKTLREYEELQSKIESLESKMIINELTNDSLLRGDKGGLENFDKIIPINSDFEFKNVVFQAKSLFPNQNILVYTDEWNFLILSHSISAKDLSTKLWLKWWWNENIVQGRDIKVLELFK